MPHIAHKDDLRAKFRLYVEDFVMVNKPTYEELEQRVKELEKKNPEQRQLDGRIQLLLLAIEQSSEGIAVSDLDGNLEYLNHSFAKMHGYSTEELIGKNLSIFHTPQQMPSVKKANKQLKETGSFNGEIWHVTRDGTEFPTFMYNMLVRDNNGNPIAMAGTLRDITTLKRAEEALQKAHNELEQRVKDRTRKLKNQTKKLEEVNTALRVLLTKRDEDKIYLEENVLSNVNNLILPYLNELKTVLDDRQKIYLEILESNINEIISPFAHKLSSKYMSLTPAEIRVANFVKQGIQTKEIANLLNISKKTVESHREKIRKKIGIKNRKTNLKSYLLSLH